MGWLQDAVSAAIEAVTGSSQSDSSDNYEEIAYTPPKTQAQLEATQNQRQSDATAKKKYTEDVAHHQFYDE